MQPPPDLAPGANVTAPGANEQGLASNVMGVIALPGGVMAEQVGQSVAQAGRRKITSRAELEQVAFDLFDRQGFERTTVEDIANATGIGRRTFFRYFPSKNDVPWGDFDGELARMRRRLSTVPASEPLMRSIRKAIVDFNRVAPEQVPAHRRRMELILRVPALQAHSTLRYAAWRQVIADFVADRTGLAPQALLPQAVAYAMLGVAVAAYEQWLRSDEDDLCELLEAAMRRVSFSFTLES
jgi:mycofactocin system transcriptional regulator